jgi:2-iminoacetate synthase
MGDKIKNNSMLSELDSVTCDDVEAALGADPGKYDAKRLMTLISPAAGGYLEEMAEQSQQLTRQRFGRTIQLYAPLYVSNRCIGSCRYCGYNCSSGIIPTQLSIEKAVAEADVIAEEGFRHILIVSGHDPEFVTVEYLCKLANRLRDKFSSISIEIYQLKRDEYKKLFEAGVDGVTLYQETYDRELYGYYHTHGLKSDYGLRLRAHDDTAGAGMRRLGLGFLLGLAPWQGEVMAMAEQAAYLMKHYWRCQVSFSFPRLRPAINVSQKYEHLVSDRDFVQMMLALRLCFADAGLVLSTRESASFRDNLIKIGVTRMSAGSKTNPGGYTGDDDSAEQFTIDDDRSAGQVAEAIKAVDLEVVWKDWDKSFTK